MQGKARTEPAPDKLDRAGFVEAFGNCFRNGGFLAERAFDEAHDPMVDAASVFDALRAQFRAADNSEKLEVLKAYTPLDPGIKAARIVEDECHSPGLGIMTAFQQSRLLDLLTVYAEKFGFDAIFVVRNYTTAELLAALETRIGADHATELSTTYGEVERLAEIQVEKYFS